MQWSWEGVTGTHYSSFDLLPLLLVDFEEVGECVVVIAGFVAEGSMCCCVIRFQRNVTEGAVEKEVGQLVEETASIEVLVIQQRQDDL